MSLNALGQSQLVLKASSNAAAPIHNMTSGTYAGLSSSSFDEYLGTGTTAANGALVIHHSILDIPSVGVAAACIVEGWQTGIVASNAVKVVGVVNFVGGVPDTANLTMNVQSAVGALVAAAQTIGFRVYIPRVKV
jgi:hypothetical protein